LLAGNSWSAGKLARRKITKKSGAVGRLSNGQLSNPILDLPGPDLPGREIYQAPLQQVLRRPVTKPRLFLDDGFDGAGHYTPPALPRRLADHIDEFGLVGHDGLSSQHANA